MPPPRTPLEPNRRRAAALWLLLALAHAALLLAWMAAAPRLRVVGVPERVLMWVVPQTHTAPPAVAVAQPLARVARPPAATRAHRAAPALAADSTPPTRPEPQAITLPPGDATPMAAAAPEPSASTPLLDNAATRAAIRRAGAQPLLAERAAAATGIPLVRADEALREDVKRAAKGDCLKGEYPFSGAYLLSLPALALAAATGNCAR